MKNPGWGGSVALAGLIKRPSGLPDSETPQR
jgi:hypothetical protein